MASPATTLAAARPTDRLSWLWLAIAAVLLPFTSVQSVIAIAAWLAPIFLLRFVRTQRAAVGLPVTLLVYSLAASIAMRNDYTTVPFGPIFIGIMFGYGLAFSLPYITDRALSPRLTGVARTLIFPMAVTTIDYAMSFAPFPTYGSPAFSQYGNLPLVQVVSVAGMWGLTFLIAWSASAINAAWERDFDRPAFRRFLLPYAGVLAAVLLLGGVRLAFFPPDAPTVRVAALAPSQSLWSYLPVKELAGATNAVRDEMRPAVEANFDDLLDRSRQEARSGAKIVVWAETAAFIFEEDEAVLLERAQTLAHEEGVYLQTGLMVIKRSQTHPYGENRAVLFDPSGKQVWDYHKAFPVVVGDAAEIKAGPAVMPMVETPYGLLATVICQDADFPAYLRQAGRAGVDILLVPADDWNAIKYDHAQMQTYRAIENGVSLVRPTGKGLSLAVDFQGRVLALTDWYAVDKPTIVTSVPTRGVPTVYAFIGDSFAYASTLGLLVAAIIAFLRRREAAQPVLRQEPA